MKYIGKIVNTQGIKGEVRILSNSDFKDIRFAVGNKLQVKGLNFTENIVIEKHFQKKNFDIIKMEGINNINDALKYKNSQIFAEKLLDEDLEDGQHFIDDIIGLNAVDQDNNLLGKVVDVKIGGYQDLLVIENENKKKSLIPLVDEFVLEVTEQVITLNIIEGLIDNED